MATNTQILIFITITFLMVLILGLLHEWNQGALEWK
jgi:NADH:ubiquinone oxidoreductase subunit 3 (subunit A)